MDTHPASRRDRQSKVERLRPDHTLTPARTATLVRGSVFSQSRLRPHAQKESPGRTAILPGSGATKPRGSCAVIQRTDGVVGGQEAVATEADWPVVGGLAWSPGVSLPIAAWKAVPSNQKRLIRAYLRERGRSIREETFGESDEGVVHLRISKAILCELAPIDVRICVGNESVRHFDSVSISIDNASSRREAMTIFREWLEDLVAVGINEHSVEEFNRGR